MGATAVTGLTREQQGAREAFAAFADEHVAPHADAWDQAQTMPETAIRALAQAGHLGAVVPAEYGGAALDELTFGLLNEELGRTCSSMRSLLTVHSMVAYALARWGSREQRTRWLPGLASGECVGAFALTEPAAGSDVQALQARAERTGDGFALSGTKHYITFGERADLFLVFARLAGRACAFLVEKDRPGISVTPAGGVLGTRASMLATLRFDRCLLPGDALVARSGFGLSAVAASALELGRYSVAWGCVGLVEACANASLDYADTREQFGQRLREHQLVARMLADMVTETSAARLLCQQAGALRDSGDPRSVQATWSAKYFASRAAVRAALDAVQIHGAQGIGETYPVARYLRDAKVMEIIEGSTQLQQITLARGAYQSRRAPERVRA